MDVTATSRPLCPLGMTARHLPRPAHGYVAALETLMSPF
jgi:hypothetical protein